MVQAEFSNGDVLYASDMNTIAVAINSVSSDVEDVVADMATLSTGVAGVSTDVAELTTDVAGLTTEMDGVSTEVAELSTDVAGLSTEVAELSTDVAELSGDVAGLTTEVGTLSAEVSGISAEVEENAALLSSVTEVSGGGSSGVQLTPVWTPPKYGNINGTSLHNPSDSEDLRNWCLIFYDKFPSEVQFDTVDLPMYTSDTAHPLKVEANVVDDSYVKFNTPYVDLPHTYTASITGDDINTVSSANQRAKFSETITVPTGKCLVFAVYQGEDLSVQSSVYKTLNFRYTTDTAADTATADFVLSGDTYEKTSTAINVTTSTACLKKLWHRPDATMNVWSLTILWNENAYSPGFILYKEEAAAVNENRLLKWNALNGDLPVSKVTDKSIGDSKIADERPAGLYLPPTLYGVVGTELNVYYDTIVPDRISSHYFRVQGNNGTAFDDCWRANTTAAATKTMVFSSYNPRFEKEYEKEVSLKIKADAITGDTKVLVVGDSIISNGSNNGMVTYALHQKNSHIITIGTQGSSTNRHEGRAGWTLANFTSAQSPFYDNGAVDFGAYMEENAFSGCEFVLFKLGINDVLSLNAYITTEQLIEQNIGHYDTLIESIHEYDPDIKIGICTTGAIPAEESLSLSYPDEGFSAWDFKRQLHEYGMGIMEEYSGREGENIFIVPFRNNIDTHDHFPTATADKNAHSDTEVKRQNNLHPTDNGYSALADSLYAFIVNNA